MPKGAEMVYEYDFAELFFLILQESFELFSFFNESESYCIIFTVAPLYRPTPVVTYVKRIKWEV